ncbi:MAG: class I fructose-bisphosphate aldolase, partial [Rhizomicrobium sp.]
SDNPGTKANLARILNHGHLGGTGKVVILPVDQGYEHGPDKSFLPNPAAYDPRYHFQLAVDAGLNAFAAPLGLLEGGASEYAGKIPLILKLTNANGLYPKSAPQTQAITAGVRDALRLGCCAVGLTIYPGSAASFEMIENAKTIIAEAKEHGLPTVVWSYPRGGELSTAGETAIDVCAYATQIAALIGTHIIKVKLPTSHVEQSGLTELYEKYGTNLGSLSDRVRHIMKSAFDGRRIVVFSGGGKKDENSIFDEARAIRDGGGTGSIIGRNSFQRSNADAREMLARVISIYRGG